MADFEAQAAAYAQAIESFCTEHELPSEWFAQPDHLAIKCKDAADFDATIEVWLPQAAEFSYVELNGRRLATALLLEPITVGNLGSVEWLEIMEPRPEKVGADTVGIDHMEFAFADFETAREVLDEKDIDFEDQQNPNHSWLSILANGHEFKLNDRVLADIVEEELSSGEAIALK